MRKELDWSSKIMKQNNKKDNPCKFCNVNDDSKTLTVNDLNPAKEDAYERITDMLCEDEDDEDE